MSNTNSTVKTVKFIIAALGVISAIYIGVATPFEGLSAQGSIGLAVFWCSVIFWVTDVIPDYITALLMMVAWAAFKAVPFGTAFSAFSTTTVWLLIGAFVLATAIGKCGLLNRFALFLMTKFPLTFKGQTLGLAITSLVMAPLVPSVATKGAILGPLSKTISDNMGYERQSNEAVGIFNSMYIPTGILYTAFLSGSFMCYMILGMLPKETQASISWLSWFLYSSVWMVVVFVLSFIFIQIFHKPKNAQQIGGDELVKRRKALGNFTKNEKIVMVVMIACLAFWITEKMHGVNSAIVTLLGAAILLTAGIIDRQSFRSNIPWDLVIFVGAVACSGPVFKATGIDLFLGEKLGPLVMPMIEANFVYFIVVFSLFMYVIRFVVTSQTAVLTIFVVLLTPVAVKLGISPWVTAFVIYTSCLVWVTKYQNLNFITIFAMVAGVNDEKDLVRHSQTVPMSICYMVVTIIGCIASIPLWKALGLM